MIKFNNAEDRFISFQKSKMVEAVIGKGFDWSADKQHVCTCFDLLVANQKNPANGWYKRIANFAKHAVPAESWVSRIEQIMAMSKNSRFNNTESNFTILYGDVFGKIKWEEYCSKQAISNSYIYKKEKHGWTKDEFAVYNKSRAVTLINMIGRYGEDVGLAKWQAYCDRQRDTCSLAYFKKKWGEITGSIKYHNWMKLWLSSGEAEAQALLAVQQVFPDKIFDTQIRLRKSGQEDCRFGFFYDFGCIPEKKLIEYNGSFWHADPRQYAPDFILPSKMTAKDKWVQDMEKISVALEQGYSVFTIWEYDWINNHNEVISNLKDWWV